MKIFIVGMGYVGLVNAACLAEMGHKVCGADINEEKIDKLERGRCPIYEPGLQEILRKNLKAGKLTFQIGVDKNINKFDMVMIAVGTPEREVDGRADLFYVGETAREIAKHCVKKELLVVGKSTVPIGTANQIRESLAIFNRKKTRFYVGSNPETLREGKAIYDFMNPDRIIIGGDKRVRDALLKLYEKINAQKIVTNARSAEMIKLASNFMLALRVSATNILAQLCEATGADIEEVMKGVGMDKRIGPHFLRAGIGYGGSCFPKDTKSIKSIAEHYRLDTSLFDSVMKINAEQRRWLCQKVEEMTLFTLKNKKIAVWGLAFKPNTDDIREAPSIDIIKWLTGEGALVSVYDPAANVKKIFGGKIWHCGDKYEAIKDAEILLILTEWNEFREADLARVKKMMLIPKIVDGRNIFDPKTVRKLGFEYAGMGRL